MKGYAHWIWLFVLILIVCIFYTWNKQRREQAQAKRDLLIEEMKRRTKEGREMRKLRDSLQSKYNRWLYPGYTVLIICFFGISTVFGVFLLSKTRFDAVFSGVVVTEALIMIITLYTHQKAVEIKHLLTQFAPFLRVRVFGEHANIDSDISVNDQRIIEIEMEIAILDDVILT